MKKSLIILLALISLILLYSSLFQINKVRGDAMSPAIHDNQTLLFWKLGTNDLQRGDIVIYQPLNSSIDRVGRIVTLPKESLRIQNGNLYIDTNTAKFRIEEEYLAPHTLTQAVEKDWVNLGEFEYIILPDNRDTPFSLGSQVIPKFNIKGVLVEKF